MTPLFVFDTNLYLIQFKLFLETENVHQLVKLVEANW